MGACRDVDHVVLDEDPVHQHRVQVREQHGQAENLTAAATAAGI
jgi:hypothetical protein